MINVLRRFIKLDELGTFGHELIISTYKAKQTKHLLTQGKLKNWAKKV